MGNKLPEVGKKYKSIVDGHIIQITKIETDIFWSFDCGLDFTGKKLPAPKRYLEYFEELPSETKEKPKMLGMADTTRKSNPVCSNCGDQGACSKWCPVAIKEEPKLQKKDEVQVVLEELKKSIHESWHNITIGTGQLSDVLVDVRQKAQNLVDALEKQNDLLNQEGGTAGIEKPIFDCDKIKIRDGFIVHSFNEWMEIAYKNGQNAFREEIKSLEDKIINHIDSLEERIKKLEEK